MFKVSVLNNTNKIIGSSRDNLSHIRDGSLLKIEKDNVLYEIAKVNKIFYIKDFEVFAPKIIVINSDTGIDLQKHDTIKISYKEYELDNINEIKEGGKFFAVNDLLVVKDGESSVDISTGLSNPTKLCVEKINEFGGVSELSLKDKGKYIIPPDGDCEVIGGHGEGVILNLKFAPTDVRTTIERTIEDINIKENKTYLTLNYSINNGIEKGKLSTEKYEIILSSNYMGGDRVNVLYEIYKDFTQHFKIPLIVKNSQSPEMCYNRAMQIIDEQLHIIKREMSKRVVL